MAVETARQRNRKGLVTVVLSERDFPILEKSEELISIDLGKGTKKGEESSTVINKSIY